MAYCSPQDLLDRYDSRVIGDLVSDDNTRASEATLQEHPKLQSALDDASGDIEAALFVARRYSPQDLAGLEGHAASHLIRITCDIAMSLLLRRRVDTDPERATAQIKLAEDHLERLRKGIDVFGLDDQKDAGLVSTEGPTTVDYSNMHLIRDQVRNYYPQRVNPFNR